MCVSSVYSTSSSAPCRPARQQAAQERIRILILSSPHPVRWAPLGARISGARNSAAPAAAADTSEQRARGRKARNQQHCTIQVVQ